MAHCHSLFPPISMGKIKLAIKEVQKSSKKYRMKLSSLVSLFYFHNYYCQCRQPSKVVLRALQVQAESEAEKKLAEILKKSFTASQIAVRDISGLLFQLVKLLLLIMIIYSLSFTLIRMRCKTELVGHRLPQCALKCTHRS